MAIDIIILVAAWISSFGLLGVILAWHARAEAAQEKIAAQWALRWRKPQSADEFAESAAFNAVSGR